MSTDNITVVVKEADPIQVTIKDAQPIQVTVAGMSTGVSYEDIELAIKELLLSEDLTAQVDNVKTVFNLTNKYVTGKIKVWINGLKERGIVEVNDQSIEIIPPPEVGDSIEVEYIKKTE